MSLIFVQTKKASSLLNICPQRLRKLQSTTITTAKFIATKQLLKGFVELFIDLKNQKIVAQQFGSN